MVTMQSAARHVEFTARPGEGDALAAVLAEVAVSLRGTAGLDAWVVSRVAGDPDRVVVDERWHDAEVMRAAAEASKDDELFPKVAALLDPDRSPVLQELEPVEGVGLLPPPRPGAEIRSIDDVDDDAPGFGIGEFAESRFPRTVIGLERTGVAHFRLKAGKRFPFGHRHAVAEETYVVLGGSGRVRLDDEVRELADRDVLRVGPQTWRCFEADDAGLEILALGPHRPGDGEMRPGWWGD